MAPNVHTVWHPTRTTPWPSNGAISVSFQLAHRTLSRRTLTDLIEASGGDGDARGRLVVLVVMRKEPVDHAHVASTLQIHCTGPGPGAGPGLDLTSHFAPYDQDSSHR